MKVNPESIQDSKERQTEDSLNVYKSFYDLDPLETLGRAFLKDLMCEEADHDLQDLSQFDTVDKSRKSEIEVSTKQPETIEVDFKLILSSISSNQVSRQIINNFSALLKTINYDEFLEFMQLIEEDQNMLYLLNGPGFINLIKPIYELCLTTEFKEKSNNSLVDRFFSLMNKHFDEIIFDKLTFRIIEKTLKLNLVCPEVEIMKERLINNLFKYSSNEFSCHVIKVYLSVCTKDQSMYDKVYRIISKEIIKFSTNKSSSSLVISCLYIFKGKLKFSLINGSLNFIAEFANNKYSSGVLEKFIEHGGKIFLNSLVDVIASDDYFIKLCYSSYGIFILKKIFQFASKVHIHIIVNNAFKCFKNLPFDLLNDEESSFGKIRSLIEKYNMSHGPQKRSKFVDCGKNKEFYADRNQPKRRQNDYMKSDSNKHFNQYPDQGYYKNPHFGNSQYHYQENSNMSYYNQNNSSVNNNFMPCYYYNPYNPNQFYPPMNSKNQGICELDNVYSNCSCQDSTNKKKK